MAHCIQVIVASTAVAEAICALFPQLRRVTAPEGFSILPIDANFVYIATKTRPQQCTETFMLLTDKFRSFLRGLSRVGPLAYLETEYFGGAGGQGAAVYSNREVKLEPAWQDFGIINQALGLIGVKASKGRDCFDTMSLCNYRSIDDLIEAAIFSTTSKK